MKIKYIKNQYKEKNFKLNLQKNSYVDDVQTIIAPTTQQISKKEEVIKTIIIEDKIESFKNKEANKLINLAIIKNFIDEEDKELELQKVLSMNDEEFKKYQNEVLSYNNEHEVTSSNEQFKLSEAELALKRIKGNGGQPIIGDFSELPDSFEEKRSLYSIKDDKITTSNVYETKIPNFENDFENILSNKLKEQENTQSLHINNEYNVQKEVKGFTNLQGLTKPIQIQSKQQSFKELFSELDWTTGTNKKM